MKNSNLKFLVFTILISLVLNIQCNAQVSKANTGTKKKLKLNLETKHSPRKATIYSALLPGLGQIYNKKAWKAPIIYTLLGGGIYLVKTNSDSFRDYKNAFSDFSAFKQWKYRDIKKYPDAVKPTGEAYLKYLTKDLTETSSRDDDFYEQSFKNLKNQAKRNRDMSYIGIGLIYALNIIDATVDAHLFDFNLDDDLSLHIEPMGNIDFNIPENNNLGAKLTLKF